MPGTDLPEWSGTRQRANLSGFARLRAILWRRSLRLYELWRLGREPWFRNLRKQVKREFRGLDAFDATRVQVEADTFGETPVLTVVNLLATLESSHGSVPEPFVDLGCGRGVTCLTAASRGLVSLGFERERAWVEAAQKVAQALSLEAEFKSGDFLQHDWPHSGTFLIVATAFSDEIRDQIKTRLEALVTSTAVITVDWSLQSPSYEQLWEGLLPVDWGTAQFQISQRQPDS